MGLYGFKAQFVPFIEDGTKTHTIRRARAVRDEPGDTMHLYAGLRTKRCRLIGRYPCVKVEAISIYYTAKYRFPVFNIEGNILSTDELHALAVRDGFKDGFEQMVKYWDEVNDLGTVPFDGHIYHWRVL